MKITTIIGVILIAIGILTFVYQGISYTTKEKVVAIGPLEMSANKTRTIPLPPIVGSVAIVGGIVLLIVGARQKS